MYNLLIPLTIQEFDGKNIYGPSNIFYPFVLTDKALNEMYPNREEKIIQVRVIDAGLKGTFLIVTGKGKK